MPHTPACDLCLLRVLGVQQLWEGSEMAQMPGAHVLLTLGMEGGEAAFPTCQELKLNWARNTPWFLLLEDRSQLSLSICGTRKGQVEFCGLEALRSRFFSFVPILCMVFGFLCLNHRVWTFGPGADVLSLPVSPALLLPCHLNSMLRGLSWGTGALPSFRETLLRDGRGGDT